MNPIENKALEPVTNRKRVDDGNHYYDSIVQNLQASGNNWSFTPRAIGVTASQSREGTTTVASNLAISASGSATGRVLLVDANFANPGVSKTFRQRGSKEGLSDVLAGKAELFDCVRDTSIERLSVLLPGRVGRRDDLSSCSRETLEELVDNLKYVFQLVILDLPVIDDGLSCLKLAGIVDGLLLVVGAGAVPRDQVRRTAARLGRSGGNVIGVVLNKTR